MNYADESLFTREKSILEEIRKYLTDGSHDVAGMRDCLSRMAGEYAQLLKTMQKIVKIGDAQAREMKQRESELHLLLDNARQGFLSFGRDLLVNKQYSQECTRIFNRKIFNLNVC